MFAELFVSPATSVAAAAHFECLQNFSSQEYPVLWPSMSLIFRRKMSLEDATRLASSMPLEKAMDISYPGVDKSAVLAHRVDVKRYLSNAFKDPQKLLEVMLLTNSFISGSRALDFFLPGVVEPSDWDVFCCGEDYQSLLLLHELKLQGFVPALPEVSDMDAYNYGDKHNVLEGTVDFNSTIHKVQLIRCPMFSDLGVLLGFHSSIVRCMISGHSLVSVNSTLTSRRMSTQYYVSEPLASTRDAAILKYVNRGIKYIPNDSQEVLEYTNAVSSLENCGSYVLPLDDIYSEESGFRKVCTFARMKTYQNRWIVAAGRVEMIHGPTVRHGDDSDVVEGLFRSQMATTLELVSRDLAIRVSEPNAYALRSHKAVLVLDKLGNSVVCIRNLTDLYSPEEKRWVECSGLRSLHCAIDSEVDGHSMEVQTLLNEMDLTP